jgi:L-malate glycosyltransferase
VTTIHQLVVGASAGDAITTMALDLQSGLRRFGDSEIFALYQDPSMMDRTRAIHELPTGRPGDLIVYHSSYGDPAVTKVLLDRHERLVLVYHNVTPSKYFVRLDPRFAAGLEWARHELELLRPLSVLNVADSGYNATELRHLGYDPVHEIRAGLVPDRLTNVAPDVPLAGHLRDRYPDGYVMVIAQLLPHKRIDVVVQAVHLLQWTLRRRVGLVVVGPTRFDTYTTALHRLARSLRVTDAWFTGRLSDGALAAVLAGATAFVSASEHEGLGIPPLEAMAMGVPAIVRDAGATCETVAGAALVLPDHAGPAMFAEAIERVLTDEALRSTLIARGFSRIDELRTEQGADSRFFDLVSELVTT